MCYPKGDKSVVIETIPLQGASVVCPCYDESELNLEVGSLSLTLWFAPMIEWTAEWVSVVYNALYSQSMYWSNPGSMFNSRIHFTTMAIKVISHDCVAGVFQ